MAKGLRAKRALRSRLKDKGKRLKTEAEGQRLKVKGKRKKEKDG